MLYKSKYKDTSLFPFQSGNYFEVKQESGQWAGKQDVLYNWFGTIELQNKYLNAGTGFV